MTKATKYEVTIEFISGNLEGLTYTDVRTYAVEVGKVVNRDQWTPSGYRVISCKPLD